MVPEFLSLTSANSPTGSNRKASGPGHSESNQFLVQVLCRRRNTDVVCLTLPRSKIVIAIKRLKFHYAEKHQSPVNECFRIILHILHALEYLELNRIVHNDIKPSNIGLNSRLKAKLLDFGSAYSLDEILVADSRPAGTLVFQPPEFFLSSSNFMSTSYECFDCKTDIWSVGVTIYFICSHRLPYEGNTYFEILEKMRSTLLVFEDERFSQELQIFIRSSLARNIKQRPNAKECLNFEWIAKENQKCHKKFNKMIYRKKPKILKSVADKNKGHLRKKNLDFDFSDSISYTGLEEDPDFYESICWNRLPKKYRGSCI